MEEEGSTCWVRAEQASEPGAHSRGPRTGSWGGTSQRDLGSAFPVSGLWNVKGWCESLRPPSFLHNIQTRLPAGCPTPSVCERAEGAERNTDCAVTDSWIRHNQLDKATTSVAQETTTNDMPQFNIIVYFFLYLSIYFHIKIVSNWQKFEKKNPSTSSQTTFKCTILSSPPTLLFLRISLVYRSDFLKFTSKECST